MKSLWIYIILVLSLSCKSYKAVYTPSDELQGDRTGKKYNMERSGYSLSEKTFDSTYMRKKFYDDAYSLLEGMLEGKDPDFKRAVFETENAYMEGKLSYKKFCQEISEIGYLCTEFLKTNDLVYEYEDKEQFAKNAAIFKFMTDTIDLKVLLFLSYEEKIAYMADTAHYPFTYDFDDYNGKNDWSKMFVTKLLKTNSGNCHSLPFLYKIIAEEIGTNAYLALSPNHIYLKHRSEKTGWYNTELTSGMFPLDGWIMASGYINKNAIVNGIYMDTLSLTQSVTLCLVDLAKGYERKFGITDGKFIIQCCDLALQFFPNNINALLLKAETMKKQFDRIIAEHNAQYPSDIFHIPEAKSLFSNMEKIYVSIANMGYREMPEKMYQDWLLSLKAERGKYQNKKLINEK